MIDRFRGREKQYAQATETKNTDTADVIFPADTRVGAEFRGSRVKAFSSRLPG